VRAGGTARLEEAVAAYRAALIANARAKRERKGCDWIVANDVSPPTGIMGGDRNTVHLVTGETA
jgi:phosphopantothenoylcysteine decarboxylase / phosphopantothenate---cysteine ligase